MKSERGGVKHSRESTSSHLVNDIEIPKPKQAKLESHCNLDLQSEEADRLKRTIAIQPKRVNDQYTILDFLVFLQNKGNMSEEGSTHNNEGKQSNSTMTAGNSNIEHKIDGPSVMIHFGTPSSSLKQSWWPVLVRRIPLWCGEEDLRATFTKRFGPVCDVAMQREKKNKDGTTNRTKNAVVAFHSLFHADEAVQAGEVVLQGAAGDARPAFKVLVERGDEQSKNVLKRLYVHGSPAAFGGPAVEVEAALRAAFGRYGALRELFVPAGNEGRHTKGFAFVEFEEIGAAIAAIQAGSKKLEMQGLGDCFVFNHLADFPSMTYAGGVSRPQQQNKPSSGGGRGGGATTLNSLFEGIANLKKYSGANSKNQTKGDLQQRFGQGLARAVHAALPPAEAGWGPAATAAAAAAAGGGGAPPPFPPPPLGGGGGGGGHAAMLRRYHEGPRGSNLNGGAARGGGGGGGGGGSGPAAAGGAGGGGGAVGGGTTEPRAAGAPWAGGAAVPAEESVPEEAGLDFTSVYATVNPTVLQSAPVCCVPAERHDNRDWEPAHIQLVNEMNHIAGEHYNKTPPRDHLNCLFLGDSIVERLRGTRFGNRSTSLANTKQAFDEIFNAEIEGGSPMTSVALGISGDSTQHLLWRLQNGELPTGLKCHVAIILIGTNNVYIPPKYNPHNLDFGADDIFEGIKLIINEVHQRLPDCCILVLGILPRGFQYDKQGRDSKTMAKIKGINSRLEKYAEKHKSDKKIYYADCGQIFIDPDNGEINRALMDDALLHPSYNGYVALLQNLLNHVSNILEERANTGKGALSKYKFV